MEHCSTQQGKKLKELGISIPIRWGGRISRPRNLSLFIKGEDDSFEEVEDCLIKFNDPSFEDEYYKTIIGLPSIEDFLNFFFRKEYQFNLSLNISSKEWIVKINNFEYKDKDLLNALYKATVQNHIDSLNKES